MCMAENFRPLSEARSVQVPYCPNEEVDPVNDEMADVGCAGTHEDEEISSGTEVCIGMCAGMRLDTSDMCIGVKMLMTGGLFDLWMQDMCVDMCREMRIDMCIDICKNLNYHAFTHAYTHI